MEVGGTESSRVVIEEGKAVEVEVEVYLAAMIRKVVVVKVDQESNAVGQGPQVGIDEKKVGMVM